MMKLFHREIKVKKYVMPIKPDKLEDQVSMMWDVLFNGLFDKMDDVHDKQDSVNMKLNFVLVFLGIVLTFLGILVACAIAGLVRIPHISDAALCLLHIGGG